MRPPDFDRLLQSQEDIDRYDNGWYASPAPDLDTLKIIGRRFGYFGTTKNPKPIAINFAPYTQPVVWFTIHVVLHFRQQRELAAI